MSEGVVLLGLDAACFEQVEPLLAEGAMPNLERLLDSGVGTELETTTPPWTPSAWPSMVTGTKPTTHGVYDFNDYDLEYDSDYVSAEDISAPFLWEYLSECGLSSIVVNVPVTHPAHEFTGSLIPGYLASEQAICLVNGEPRPMDEFNDYRIYAKGKGSKDRQLTEYEQLIQSRTEMAKRLAMSQSWSFMMVQFQRTDSVFHKFGHDDDAVRRIYSAVDDAIGSILKTVGDSDILLASDHGMHQYEWIFHCNTWLKENGYLQTTTESERKIWDEEPKGSIGRETTETDDGERSYLNSVFSVTLDALYRIGVTPRRAERALSIVGFDDTVRKALPSDVLADAAEHVDWQRSEAYCRSLSCLGIRFNVDGRESEGTIPADEFDEVRAALVRDLRNVCTPDGKPAFDEVWDRHKYQGTDVLNEPSAPDVFLRPRAMKCEISDIIRNPVFQSTDAYNHKYEGLLIASGPNIRSSVDVSPHITDVAPTVLRLLDIEPPEELDGTVISELLTVNEPKWSSPDPGPRTYVSDSPSSTSSTVENRLKDMGYIE